MKVSEGKTERGVREEKRRIGATLKSEKKLFEMISFAKNESSRVLQKEMKTKTD